MQQDLKEGPVSDLKPIREGMQNLPKVITFPQFSSITAYGEEEFADEGEEEWVAIIGDIAEQYLQKFASDSGADVIFGLRE